MPERNGEKEEWNATQHHLLVLVLLFNRVINTWRCQQFHDVAVHSLRAVIRPCHTDTTDRPGRLEQAGQGRSISGWMAAKSMWCTSGLAKTRICTLNTVKNDGFFMEGDSCLRTSGVTFPAQVILRRVVCTKSLLRICCCILRTFEY